MSNNQLLAAAAVATALGLGIYALTSSGGGTRPYNGGTYIPPGANYGGYQNNSSTGMWLNFFGQLFNAGGQLIGTLANNGVFTPHQPTGDEETVYWWEAEDEEGVDVILGSRVGCPCEHSDSSYGVDAITEYSGGIDTRAPLPGMNVFRAIGGF